MTLQNKSVVVVGGSSGIGYRVAELAASRGAALVIAGRDRQRLEAAVQGLAPMAQSVRGLIVDAADPGQVAMFFDAVGAFDHLVSTVGGAMGGGFLDAPFETIQKAVEEKLFHNLRLARKAAPFIRPGGSMTFTSGSGARPHQASGAVVGNAALQLMVEGLASELAPEVRVNDIVPTWTETPFWHSMPKEQIEATRQHFSQMIPLGRTATIDEVASAYLFLMENKFVTGQHVAVDGGVMLRI